MRVSRYLTSVRFFLVVGGLLAVFSALATVIPQGLAGNEYAARLGRVPATVVILLGVNDFYRSPLFFLLGALLELNLLACTVPRLRRRIAQLRSSGLRVLAFAPDAIHAGLAILIISFIVGAAVREEYQFTGTVGEVFSAGEHRFRVVNARAVEDDGGVVVSWEIDIGHKGATHRLAVNRPIAVGGYRLHFRHYELVPIAALTAADGETGFQLRPGDALTHGGGALLRFESVAENGNAVFVLSGTGYEATRLLISAGEEVAGLTYTPAGSTTVIGFSATRNPARPGLLAGFMVAGLGLALYTIDKGKAHG